MIFPRVPGLVSIVIPSYNYARYVPQCLESIRQQTYENIEIIFVDDASTDDTCRALERWKESWSPFNSLPNIISIRLPRHIGYAGVLTLGFFLTNGEYIAIQDLDDLSVPTRIEAQVNHLKSHPDIDLVGTNIEFFDDDQFDERVPCDWIEYGDEIQRSLVLGRPALCMSSVLFKGVIFDYLGGLTREPLGLEDSEFLKKLNDNQIGIDNIQDVLYYARNHAQQRSRRLQSMMRRTPS